VTDYEGTGPPTIWRLARHGRLKELEAQLTSDNCDDADARGMSAVRAPRLARRASLSRGAARSGCGRFGASEKHLSD